MLQHGKANRLRKHTITTFDIAMKAFFFCLFKGPGGSENSFFKMNLRKMINGCSQIKKALINMNASNCKTIGSMKLRY